MKAWEAAIEVLKETDNPAVMWGDYNLLHLIADKLGWVSNGFETPKRVLRALSKTPGGLVKRYTSCGRRTVLIFLLPEEAIRRGTMSVIDVLKAQIKEAMRSKDTVRRDLFRMILADVDSAELKNGKALTDDQVYKLMKIVVSNNDKTLHGYTDKEGFKPGIDQRIVNATGADLEACETQRTKLNTENDLLNALIPKTLTLDEVRAMLAPVADAIKAAAGDKPAMGVAMPIFKKGGHIVESTDVAAVIQELRA